MHILSKLDARHILLLLAITTVILSSPYGVSAQDNALDILMDDVDVHAILSDNGTSTITFYANVTNVGSTITEFIDIRIDLRDVDVKITKVDGSNASSNVIPASNYAIIRVTPSTAFDINTSHQLEIMFASNVLQEFIGICEDRSICLGTAIFYVRPINEFRDFTFKVTLPQHGILDTESTPLYPTPTRNYTDGTRMVFVWEAGQIFPGQERVFIIKYGVPNFDSAVIDPDINFIPFMLLAAVSGAVVVILAQRIPEMIRTARVPRALRDQGMTEHEEQVIQFITRKGGSCSQRDIYDELDKSQSLVSMVLTGLEQRGVIRRFREGRENVIHLVEE